MKTKILLFYFLILYTVGLKGQNTQLKSFKITAVAFGITTPMSVSCGEFENTFPNKNYVTKNFNDSIHVSQFEHALRGVKYGKKGAQDINVRAKVYLEYGTSHSESVLCIDKFYDIELDGRLIKKNRAVIDFLKHFLKSFE